MKHLISAFALAAILAGCGSSSSSSDDSQWELTWCEDFDRPVLDSAVWGNCDRGEADWANTQSADPSLYDISNGCLVLKGIVNPDTIADPAPYLTGGVWTKNRKSFAPGKFEIRAKLQGAQGAWPAIWLMPFDRKKEWPDCGEIDIMERLNFDDFVYQTVHSYYTYVLHHADNPKNTGTAKIKPDDFNVYGVEIFEDKIVFTVNGVHNHTYPRINDGADGQFPFYQDYYLLIDMQLGGEWVGEVNPADLPVEMQVDWVKHYTLKK